MKQRRGARLKGSDKTLFSGEFWIAQAAIELGLADHRGDLRSALRERYGDKVRMPLISAEKGFFARKISGLKLIDALGDRPSLADDMISALENRAVWSRYGL